jgi:hypothetical protein
VSFFRRNQSAAGLPAGQLERMSARERRAYLATYRISARDWTPAQLRQMEQAAADIRKRQGSR